MEIAPLLQKYMQIMTLVKAQNGINFKLESGWSPEPRTKIFVQNLLTDKVILAEEFREEPEHIRQSISKTKKHISILIRKR